MTHVDGRAVQARLPLPAPAVEVPIELVRAQPSVTRAIVLAAEVSGRGDKALAFELGIDQAQWSRIKVGQAHFPQEKLLALFAATGSQAPLVWLADRCGYELVRRESAVEFENRRLRERVAELERERAVVTQFLRESRG